MFDYKQFLLQYCLIESKMFEMFVKYNINSNFVFVLTTKMFDFIDFMFDLYHNCD